MVKKGSWKRKKGSKKKVSWDELELWKVGGLIGLIGSAVFKIFFLAGTVSISDILPTTLVYSTILFVGIWVGIGILLGYTIERIRG